MRHLLSFILSVCFFTAASTLAFADESLARVTKAGELRIGIAVNAPWIIKRQDGTLVGFDIDLGKAIASDLGVKPEFVEMPFTDLIPSLAKGEVDLIASGLAITGNRAREVVFSTPTGITDIRVVTGKGLGKSDPATRLERSGVAISVLAGSTDEAAAKAAFPDAHVIAYPSYSEALAALVTGKAEAMAATEPVPQMIESFYGGKYQQVGPALTRTAEAIAFKPDDVRLQSYVNNWLTARSADGFLDNVRQHWFSNFDWIEPAQLSQAESEAQKKAN